MNRYCIYLRKSRADLELDKTNELDTLERQKKILLEFADKNNFKILKIFSEVVSGETISSRPEMQKLLSEIEKRLWDGVIVMEVERLARGDTIDQGIIARYFSLSETKIITPTKTYDPNNEFDEEYFEFGLFMSRREYKTINRRLQNGRIQSVKEGKYVGSVAPYGYKKTKLEKQKGYSLEIVEDEAKIVKHIFNLCAKGYGTTLIADELNKIGIEPKNKALWTANTIRDMLRNPIYIGKIRWNYRKTKKNTENGEIKITRPLNNNYLLINGMHKNIISNKLFEKVQFILKAKSVKCIPQSKELQNPYAGIINCGLCGKKMIRKPGKNGKSLLFCANNKCSNIASYFSLITYKIENIIISELNQTKIIYNYSNNRITESDELKLLNKELEKAKMSLEKIYNAYEKEIYSEEIFLKRKENILNVISFIENKIKKIIINDLSCKLLVPKIYTFISDNNISPILKNKLFSKLIDKIVYIKEKGGKGYEDNFIIKIFFII